MPASQQNITLVTPMGANLIAGGATFRVWAPNAYEVYIIPGPCVQPIPLPISASLLLIKDPNNGHWTGFIPNLKKGDLYMYYVVGAAGASLKRDPQARELTTDNDSINWRCILVDPTFPWHDSAFVTPQFSDIVIYQLHVGTYYVPDPQNPGTFLDVACKVPYLADLGVTVIQLLPIHEWESFTSQGYNGVDFYSPEQLYTVSDPVKLPVYLANLNKSLSYKQLTPYQLTDIQGSCAQLRALVDLCHCYGLAVIFDLVFSNAKGSDNTGQYHDEHEMIYFDMQDHNPPFANSLYVTTTEYIGHVFDYEKPEVCDFLINNAKMFLTEYHVDGFRYDEISNLIAKGKQPYAWAFCQNLTSTLKFIKPNSIHKAEYWQGEYWQDKHLVVTPAPTALGFDTVLSDSQRNVVRNALGAASQMNNNPLNMKQIGGGLCDGGYQYKWQTVQGPENHDITFYNNDGSIRIAKLSDPSDPRSWYATSRSRVAMGICLTGPGIPMMFMGQEFLEDKTWSDDQTQTNHLIYWNGINNPPQIQKKMTDFLRFTRELIALRWQNDALRAEGFAYTHNNDESRMLAFHRWVPGEGKDVMVVVHLGNSNAYQYRIGFPSGGIWKEVFNSDIYENWVNPDICGNGGQAFAENHPYDGFNYSASLSIPANGILVFAM